MSTPSSTRSQFDRIEKGTQLRVMKGIYDSGEGCYPPGYISFSGDIVYALEVSETFFVHVSHRQNTTTGFFIERGEFEIME